MYYARFRGFSKTVVSLSGIATPTGYIFNVAAELSRSILFLFLAKEERRSRLSLRARQTASVVSPLELRESSLESGNDARARRPRGQKRGEEARAEEIEAGGAERKTNLKRKINVVRRSRVFAARTHYPKFICMQMNSCLRSPKYSIRTQRQQTLRHSYLARNV